MPMYGKNLSKIFLSGTGSLISTKLGGGRTDLVVRASDSGSGDLGSILTWVSVLFPWARDIYSPKVLVIPRNRWLRPNMTEKLFTGTLRIKANKQKQTKLGMSHRWLPAPHSLFKWWSWVDLDLFYGKVKFGNIGLSIRKGENCWFFQNFCNLWPETNRDNEDMWVLKVKVISWPWPKVIYIWKLKLAFPRNDWAILNQILFCDWAKYQVSVSQDHWSSGYFWSKIM